jgi:hypothetical protein
MKTKLLAVLLFLALSLSASVLPKLTGTFYDQNGNPATITNVFKLQSAEYINPYVAYTQWTTNVATNGVLSSFFQPGPYQVWVGPRRDPITIIVPQDTNTHNFGDLIPPGGGAINVSLYGPNFYYIFLTSPAYVGETVKWNGTNWVIVFIQSSFTFDSTIITFDSAIKTFDAQ